MKRLCLLVFLSSVAVAAPKKAAPKAPPAPPPKEKPALTAPSAKLAEAFGGKVDEQLRSATKHEVARTSYTPGIRPAPDRAIGSDFQREGSWSELDKDQVAKFRAFFYEEKNFRIGADVTKCDFKPDAAFQLSNESIDTLQLLLSFSCNQVLFFSVKQGGRSVPGVAVDFKTGRKALLALVKELLRDDAVIQALK